ncbi:unnamed protein product, partial [Lactuca virosa]
VTRDDYYKPDPSYDKHSYWPLYLRLLLHPPSISAPSSAAPTWASTSTFDRANKEYAKFRDADLSMFDP